MNNILKSDLSWNGLISSFTDLLLFSYLDDVNIYFCVNLFICTTINLNVQIKLRISKNKPNFDILNTQTYHIAKHKQL